MSVQAMAWVIEKSQHGGSALLTLLMIANHTYTDGTGGKVVLDDVASECRMSKRSLQRIIQRKLIPSGELVVRRSARMVASGEPRNTYELPGVRHDGFNFRGLPGRPATQKAGRQVVTHVGDKLGDIAMSPSKEPKVFSEKKEGVVVVEALHTSSAASPANQPPPSYQGTHFNVTVRQDRMLGEAFPWAERPAEYRRADSWLEANLDRRPRNASRFLHNWFTKIPKGEHHDGAANAKTRRGAAAIAASRGLLGPMAPGPAGALPQLKQ